MKSAIIRDLGLNQKVLQIYKDLFVLEEIA